jgi:hypothetical protein
VTSRRWSPWLLVTATGLPLLAIATLLTVERQNVREFPEFSPQSHRRFITIGSTSGGQFTAEEFRLLATTFDYVLLEKHHGSFDIELHHEAARTLKKLNPKMRVLPYFSMKYWFENNDWGGRPFNPAWYLRDNEGDIVYWSRPQGRSPVPYLDLANPAYRAWALETLRSWLKAAPYAGIFFDSTEPIGLYGEGERAMWERLLGQDRVAQYNAGMRTLIATAQRIVGSDGEIIFNGIAPIPLAGPNRNLDLLAITDGALDERFCLDVQGSVHALQEDLDLMERYENRRLFLRTTYHDRLRQHDRERYGRFCLGSFLLGWQPGLTYFQFGEVTTDQLYRDIAEMNIPTGPPVEPYRRIGDIWSRTFVNGEVYVNVGERPVRVMLSRTFVRMQGGKDLIRLEEGDTIAVPPGDAVFLLAPLRAALISARHAQP